MEGVFGSIVETYVLKFIDEVIVSNTIDRDTLCDIWHKVSGTKLTTSAPVEVEMEVKSFGGCIALFKSGQKKGKVCGKILRNGEIYCKRHSSSSSASVNKNLKTCGHTLSSGNKCKKTVKENVYCNIHEKLYKLEVEEEEEKVKEEEEENKEVEVEVSEEELGEKILNDLFQNNATDDDKIDNIVNECSDIYIFNDEEKNQVSEEKEQIFVFNEEELNESSYEKLTSRAWRHIPTNYYILRSKGKYRIEGICEEKDVVSCLTEEDVILMTGIEVSFE